MEQRHPLSGLRVLEMGSRTTAPYIGKLLTDAGADVLKLESPVGDPFGPGQRRAPPSLMVKTQHGGDSSTQAKEASPLIWKPTKAKTNSTTS